jgi:hypothetical protein
MSCRSRQSVPTLSLGLGLVLAVLGWASSPPAQAGIVVQGSFGPNGDVGFINSPPSLSITFGGDGQGQIAQMDGFINVAGQNLNNSGSGFGTSAQLTYGPPPGLNYTFSASQPTADQLLLTYQFVNNTGSSLSGFQFLPYVNPFFGTTNPNDFATVAGSTATNPVAGPSTYQVGDSSNSTIFTNVLFGTLDDSNSTTNPPTLGTNVAMALGFSLSTLGIGQSITFQVLLSDDGSSIGSLALTDQNPGYPGDTLTLSGQAVPEPSGIVLLGLGSLGALTASVLLRLVEACKGR